MAGRTDLDIDMTFMYKYNVVGCLRRAVGSSRSFDPPLVLTRDRIMMNSNLSSDVCTHYFFNNIK